MAEKKKTAKGRTSHRLHRSPIGAYRHLFAKSPAGLMLTEFPDGKVLDVNARFLQLAGRREADVLGHSMAGLDLWEDASRQAGMARQLRDHGELRSAEIEAPLPAARRRLLVVSANVIRLEGKKRVLWSAHHVTGRLPADEAPPAGRPANHRQTVFGGALARLGELASGMIELPVLREEALAVIDQALATEAAAIFELRAERRSLVLCAALGWPTGWVGGTTMPLAETHAGQALQSSQPVVVDDFPVSKLSARDVYPPAVKVRSAVTLPVCGPADNHGVLQVLSAQAGRFSRSETAFLRSVARILGTAYDRARSQDQLAEHQAAIRALSTPVLPVRNRMLVAPLVGVLDEARVRQMSAQLLESIRANRARAVVVDVTGVAAMDREVAAQLIDIFKAARLLGADVLLSGVSRKMAQVLVDANVHLGDWTVRGDLQGGIEEAERRLGYDVITPEEKLEARIRQLRRRRREAEAAAAAPVKKEETPALKDAGTGPAGNVQPDAAQPEGAAPRRRKAGSTLIH